MHVSCLPFSPSVMLLSPTLLFHTMRECHAHQILHYVQYTREETQCLIFGPDKLLRSYVNTSRGDYVHVHMCMCPCVDVCSSLFLTILLHWATSTSLCAVFMHVIGHLQYKVLLFDIILLPQNHCKNRLCHHSTIEHLVCLSLQNHSSLLLIQCSSPLHHHLSLPLSGLCSMLMIKKLALPCTWLVCLLELALEMQVSTSRKLGVFVCS